MAASCLFPFLLIFLLSFSSIPALGLQNSHVVDVHSLMPSSACSSQEDAKQGLKVIDRHGPCSPISPTSTSSPISLSQILSIDQSRVDSIHSRTSSSSSSSAPSNQSTTTTTTTNSSDSKIIARYGAEFGVANYIVTIGIGTPSKTFTVVFDTGSDVTWIQCQPCDPSSCYQQIDPIFDPSQSTTFANVSCDSTACGYVGYDCGTNNSCLYGVLYGDGSFTLGYYAEDTLSIGRDEIKRFRFGCGGLNVGLFGEVAGILALGPYKESFAAQTSYRFHRTFAYCLPPVSSSAGYLKFGTDGFAPNTKFTPIPENLKSPFYYYLNITGLTVAGESLRIEPKVFPKAGAIIDSGTVITRLPPDAYKALRSTFRKHMKQYQRVPGFSILDTCYNFTGFDTVEIPSVGIQFLNDVSLDIDPSGIFYVIDISQVCLAFASNRERDDLAILGNVQQRTYNVLYDGAKGAIGFSPGAC